eukprot:8535979-Pyramimonas_sp.AAC.1
MEMINTGPVGPRLTKAGLAIFSPQREGPRVAPQVVFPQASILQVAGVRIVALDLQTVDLPR